MPSMTIRKESASNTGPVTIKLHHMRCLKAKTGVKVTVIRDCLFNLLNIMHPMPQVMTICNKALTGYALHVTTLD